MTSLTKLRAHGLKVLRNVNMDIPRLLALGGPNGAGKTSILQAIRLGVLGHDPAIGRQLAATRQLASGREIEVSLTWSDDFALRRTFGSSTETKVSPSNGEVTEKGMQARIDEETGAFLLSFDLMSFLALSEQKRKEMLFALLPREKAGITRELFDDWNGYEGADPTIQKAIAHLWNRHIVTNPSAVDGLQAAIEAARETKNKAEQARLAQTKVVDAAERDAIASAELSVPDEALEQRLQDELGIVEQEVGELTERAAAVARAERAVRERAHNLAVLEEKERDARMRARSASDRIAALREASFDVAALEAAEDLARRRAAGQRDAVKYAAEQVAAASHDLLAAERQLAELRTRLAAPIDDDLRACPECGAQIDVLVRAKLQAEVEAATAALPSLRSAHDASRKKLQSAEERQVELDGLEREARVEVKRAREHVETLRTIEAELARYEDAATSLEGELLRLRSAAIEEAPACDTARLEPLQAEGRALRERIREQRELSRAAGRAQADRDRASTERANLEMLEEKSERLKTLHSSLQRLRAHVIQQMVGPVEAQADALLREIDDRKQFRFVFEREDRQTFDFGFEEAGVFRSYDAASTGEDAFLAVVFVAAMVAAVEPRWPVLIIDNVESVDDERRRWLMLALASVQHRFGNVILAGCCDYAEVDGWEVVDVRELAPQIAAVA